MDIVHRIGIKAAPEQVYAALATVEGLAGWWTEDTQGDAQEGGHIMFRFHNAAGAELGAFGMRVLQAAPVQQVHWRVQEGPPDWVGTEIDFVLSQQDGQTIVSFGHRHWREASDFLAHCSTKWATFLLSLRDHVETGTGRPAPRDLQISNWH